MQNALSSSVFFAMDRAAEDALRQPQPGLRAKLRKVNAGCSILRSCILGRWHPANACPRHITDFKLVQQHCWSGEKPMLMSSSKRL